ncbi:hypothetical protein [Arcticibacterium luteifluviistationis]|uniref:Uncharacterized protein n=1 Tax=Arcticibacterium luteifluviistationis TaxID=1784714 RepID=A0A2Z4G699_9BACT|nr:hypothetical protein [Arcticibacterium luteifluviistationis]AWV96672.1 hypothetical protein DJ013_00060 [Arcticibacterium luteifluviistationis]
MKKYFGLFLLIAACTTSKNIEPNQEIEIAEKATYELTIDSKDISIKVSKIEDSRCPENVVCVWAGEATVTFDLIVNEKLFSNKQLCLQCDTESGTPQEIIIENNTIKLIAVSPFPNLENSPVNKTAVFKVN